ncbi:MAG: tungsten formylmethanofuran dehydrogenase [Candidatus Latescibacterota bacterium]|nr:MAG: tungsten formylmethanofuran dehydrogenase [Candidatus Latescibacterota bacterium]
MAKVIIDKEKCKGCFLCIKACPFGVLEQSSSLNQKGYKFAQPKKGKECKGCGFCFLVCPDLAIEVKEEK